jgi:hypothetical protein
MAKGKSLKRIWAGSARVLEIEQFVLFQAVVNDRLEL